MKSNYIFKNKQIIQMAEGGFDEFENPALTKMIMMMMIPMTLTRECLWCLPMLIRELFQIRMIVLQI